MQTVSEDRIIYDNAGKTKKRGVELNTVYRVSDALDIGGSYAYSDFKFDTFEELVGYGPSAGEVTIWTMQILKSMKDMTLLLM